jgi:hypothetical protein
MSHRKHGRARRKVFQCGHRGWGKHCHRCAQADVCDKIADILLVGRKPSAAYSSLGPALANMIVGTGINRIQHHDVYDWVPAEFRDEAIRLRKLSVKDKALASLPQVRLSDSDVYPGD